MSAANIIFLSSTLQLMKATVLIESFDFATYFHQCQFHGDLKLSQAVDTPLFYLFHLPE